MHPNTISQLTFPAGIHEALRTLISLREQAEVRQLRGKLRWEGDLDDQRQARVIE